MKALPNNIELENAVLGACMLESDAFPKVADLLKEETFFNEANKAIYKAVISLYSTGSPIDILTVNNELKSLNLSDVSGGFIALTERMERINQAGNIIYHTRLLQQLQIRRQIISVATEAAARAYDDTVDVFDTLSELDSALTQFSSNAANPVHKIDKVCDIVERELFDPTIDDVGKVIPTGLVDLDNYLGGGVKLKRFILIAGRPSMGKTALVLQMMLNMARNGVPIMFFSRETDKESILKRLICNIASIEEYRMNPVSLEEFQRGRKTWLNADEVTRVTNALSQIRKLPIYINDTTGMSVGNTMAITKKMIFQHNIKVVVGDYIQLIEGSKNRNRTSEMDEISRSLKALSQNNNIALIELAQLSRKVEDRGGDKRPVKSDLRESGQLDQDGQVIILIYRPEQYGFMQDEEGNSTEGLMELIIAKNKDGATTTVPTKFTGKYFRIEDYVF